MASCIEKALMSEISAPEDTPHAKVSVVGAGQVGMAAAFTLMSQGIASEIALVDVDEKKLKGEMMDLQHGQAFIRRVTIQASHDYSITANSAICIVTAGARQRDGESRLDLVQRNVQIFKGIIPYLVKYSPNAILLVASNPVDIMTHVTWKLSGFPKHQVIGSGTMLDSSRFRFLVSQKLNVAPQNVHGYILGEHGDTSVAAWSGLSVGGIRLRDMHPDMGMETDVEKWADIHKDVINSAYEIIRLKGYTSWAIGLAISTICECILKNQRSIYALSTMIKGFYGIEEEVFLSLPCVLGQSGITHVLKPKLTEAEVAKLQNSAHTLRAVMDNVNLTG
jgi:L-lactate dehydrogenase